MINGSLVSQVGSSNYTTAALGNSSIGSTFGVIAAENGSLYRVSDVRGFVGHSGAVAGEFNLSANPDSQGLYNLNAITPAAPESTVRPGAEVQVSLVSVGVPIGNLTVGFGVGTSIAYVAFGPYPTYFSNVSIGGVAMNLTSFSRVFSINLTWFEHAAFLFGLPSNFSISAMIIANGSVSLSNAVLTQGQAQLIVSPSNVSEFISGLVFGSSTFGPDALSTSLARIREELLVISQPTPGHLGYDFVLAPDTMDRASLAGIVSLHVELSTLSPRLAAGSDPELATGPASVSAFLGVTWDTSPASTSGYSNSTVRGLWAVQTLTAVQVSAPAVGVSLTDAGNALAGMGYDLTRYTSAIASIANPAVFLITDPSLAHDVNSTAPYRSYAVAIVPADTLNPSQTSIALYLRFSGVVYNLSYYDGGCASAHEPSCPLLVVDSLAFVHPTKVLPTQLLNITTPTYIQTTGFLTGTTLKTIASIFAPALGGFSELAQLSPIDVGLYDLGYSNGWAGYNLPTIYLTWGTGPSYAESNNDSIGLYIPTAALESGWDLTNVGKQIGSLNWNASAVSIITQDIQSAYRYVISDSPFNGSVLVPGVFLMMEVWANASPGEVLFGFSGQGVQGCPLSLTEKCVVSNVSLSANAAGLMFPPNIIGVSVDLVGSTSNYSNQVTTSWVWWGPVPVDFALGAIACGPFGLCGLSPYHVVKAMLATCISTVPVIGCLSGNYAPAGTYEVAYDFSWNSTPWFAYAPFNLILS